MKLYYAPGTCALACWIALEWTKADYEVEKVDYKSEEYKKINPLASVPAIEIGLDRPMTQAGAILQYIAEKYPEANLGSEGTIEEKLEFNETMAFLTGDFHPAFWPVFAPFRYTTSEDEKDLEKAKEAAYARVDRVMTHLDKLIGDTNHVYKNKKTVADPYAYVMARWSTFTPKSWKEYPNLARFMESMKNDPSVAKVLEESRQ